jgi:MFS transporter, BCD family, chlorophyll transporter
MAASATGHGLSWLGIARLGLVQTALGAIVVLTTSTINRVMIVELSFAAMIPGVLVAWHYALQVLRPRWGHGSDTGRRRTPWIIGGMATLAAGGALAAVAVWLAAQSFWPGMALSAVAFTLIGIGVGASGTSLLVLLAETVDAHRRPAAATMVWTMMIVGFILTSVIAGHLLDPFTLARLVAVAAGVCGVALVVSTLAVWGVERAGAKSATSASATSVQRASALSPASNVSPSFNVALGEVWADGEARRFALFIFVSMLGYSAQDLILEPFAGLVFGYTPGQSTALSGTQNTGVLVGMLLVGFVATWAGKAKGLALRNWTIVGCLASAVALVGLVAAARVGAAWPLKPTVFALGFANGMFAVAAIGSMFSAAAGGGREGVRMGLFGAAQAIAFGAGGFLGTVLADALKFFTQSNAISYGTVFGLEAAFFIAAAFLAMGIGTRRSTTNPLLMAAQHDLGS